MKTGSATIQPLPGLDAWECAGESSDGTRSKVHFEGYRAKERAIEYADKDFEFVKVVEQV
jgi:hypothetical protein